MQVGQKIPDAPLMALFYFCRLRMARADRLERCPCEESCTAPQSHLYDNHLHSAHRARPHAQTSSGRACPCRWPWRWLALASRGRGCARYCTYFHLQAVYSAEPIKWIDIAGLMQGAKSAVLPFTRLGAAPMHLLGPALRLSVQLRCIYILHKKAEMHVACGPSPSS